MKMNQYAGQKINITSLLKAQLAMENVLEQPKTEFTRDAAIKRFEFTLELVWKTLKRILLSQGIIATTPKETFRYAADAGLLDSPKKWFSFLDDRNMTAHIYKEEVAERIYDDLVEFKQELHDVVEKIQKFIDKKICK